MFDAPFEIILKELDYWYIIAVKSLPGLIVAVIAVVLFSFLAKYARKASNRIFTNRSDSIAIVRLIGTTVYFIVLVTGVIIALSFLKLDGAVNKLLAGAGIIGLALGFAFQDIIANIFSGVVIAVKRIIKIGDLIETKESFGTVIDIGLRSTIINNLNGQIVIIPSRDILQNRIINYTMLGERRIEIECGISYHSDLEKAASVAINAVKKVPYLLHDKPIDLYYSKFDSSSINFILYFWIKFNKQPEYLEALSEAIINITKDFAENNITIPYPIRTINIQDFNKIEKKEL